MTFSVLWRAGTSRRLQCSRLLIPVVAVAITLAFAAAPAGAAQTYHEFSATFGAEGSTPSNPYPLSNPSDVAIDSSGGPSNGDIYVTDPANHRVEKFSPSGEFLLMFGKEVNKTEVEAHGTEAQQSVCTVVSGNACQAGAAGPSPGALDGEERLFLAVDNSPGGEGDVYVGDPGDNLVSKFDSSGNLIASWGDNGPLGSPNGQLGGFSAGVLLTGIAVDPSGYLFVALTEEQEEGDTNFYRYSQTGILSGEIIHIRYFRSAPRGLAVDAEGNLFYSFGEVEEINDKGASLYYKLDGGSVTARGLAIDPTDNDLYISERGNEPGGGLIDHFELGGCEGCSPLDSFGEGDHLSDPQGLAVSASSRAVYVANTGAGDVVVFGANIYPATVTGPIENESPEHLSATLTGRVDRARGGEIKSCHFEYGPKAGEYTTGTLPCEPKPPYSSEMTAVTADVSGLTLANTYHFRLVASNAAGNTEVSRDSTFVLYSVAGVETELPTSVGPTGATLKGAFMGNGKETKYSFQWGTNTIYGHETPIEIAGSPTVLTHVSAGIVEELVPATTYQYRMVATNSFGTTYGANQSFTTEVDSPSVAESVSGVQSDLAQLQARIRSNGEPTAYHFEYGTEACSANPDSCASTPTAEIGPGNTFQTVSAQVSGLTHGTVYHWRVVATNAVNTTYGSDRNFTTYSFTPFNEPCPNAHVRQQTGAAALVDCRAYELVSAASTGGYDVESNLTEGQTPYAGYPEAEDPSNPEASARVLYAVHDGGIPGTDNPTNRGPDPYIATRGEDGWSTEYVGVPASNPFSVAPFTSIPSGADTSLETFAYGSPGGCSPCFAGGYTGIPVRFDGKLVQGMAGSENPGPSAKPAGHIAKDLSANGEHFVFGSKSRFEPDGNEGVDLTIYDRNLKTEETHVVSKTPGGATMKEEGKEIAELDISKDGSHILIGQLKEEKEGAKYWHLYMNVGDSERTIDLTPDATEGVRFDGMTADGSKVFFSSEEHLTGEDEHHSGADIFMWEEGHPLTLISTGTEGDASSCDPVSNTAHEHWNTKGVQNCSDVVIGGGGGVASGDGTVYFLSPSLLDGTEEPTDGVKNAPNLYAARPGQAPHFVSTMESSLNGPHQTRHSHIGSFGSLTEPKFIAVDNSGGGSNGDIYVYENVASAIFKYNSSHELITSWSSHGKLGGFTPEVDGIAVGPSDTLYVLEGTRMFEFNQDGTLKAQIDNFDGTQSNFYPRPRGIAVDSTGNVYFITGGLYTTEENVSIASSSGGPPSSVFGQAPGLEASALALDPANGDLYVLNKGDSIYRYYLNSSVVEILPGEASEFLGGKALAVDSSHDIYVDEGDRIVEFGPSGNQVVEPFGSGLLTNSASLAFDSAGDMYAGNPRNGNVQEFGPSEPNPNPQADNPAVVDAVDLPESRHTADFQVTPNGEFAVFTSTVPLTGFESSGHEEVYRYAAASESLTCVSCDPTGDQPSADSELAPDGLSLTNDGRVFFTTAEPLVERDADNRKDVYEWEPQGAGPEAAVCKETNFTFSKASGGCLDLISTGTSAFDSSLLGVSANGTDAYFFSRDTLVSQAENSDFVKIYDARELGGFEYTPPHIPCKASDECHGPSSPAPPLPNINVNTGTNGNEVPPAAKEKCKTGFVDKHGKCVKKPHRPKRLHKKKHHRGGKR